MKIRIKYENGEHADLTVGDHVKKLTRVRLSNRGAHVVTDMDGDSTYSRTNEVEAGRIVFK